MAVGGCHRDVNARREQHPTAPGVRRKAHAVRRGQCGNTPDLSHAARAGDVRLRNVESTALEQILEVETRELAFTRGDGDGGRTPHFRLAGVIVRRYRLLKPGDVVWLKLPGKLDGGRNLKRAVRVDHEFDVGPKPAAGRLHSAHAIGDREPVATHHAHLGGGEALGSVSREFCLSLVAGRPAAAGVSANRTAYRAKRLV